MEKEPKDFGAIKNSITDKTIREMSWEEIFTLARDSKPMNTEEALCRMRAVRTEHDKGKSA